MSGKFASLTAGLLVRKGEARPSSVMPPGFTVPRMPELVHTLTVPLRPDRPEPPMAETPQPEPPRRNAACSGDPPPPASSKPRRLVVTLTPAEYETLGIIGVKKSVTRHQLLRNALDEYLALLVEEFGSDCQCIYSGSSCGNSCGSRD